jgi:peptidyl-tRNA hydrolase
MTSPAEDPILMYIVVRESLKLSGGKLGAQCGHAVDYLWREVYRSRDPTHIHEPTAHLHLFNLWMLGEHGKIVLGASDQEFEKIKAEYQDGFLVVDNGHTEVAPKTETCFGMWPQRKSERSKTLKRLRLLTLPAEAVFLIEVREAARRYGWTGDYVEVSNFVKHLYARAGVPITEAELEPYPDEEGI